MPKLTDKKVFDFDDIELVTQPDERNEFTFRGGEEAASERLLDYYD